MSRLAICGAIHLARMAEPPATDCVPYVTFAGSPGAPLA